MELGKEGNFNINVYSPGNLIAREITINGNVSLGGDAEHRGYTDEQVAEALTACVGTDRVISNKRRWAGAYWYLRWVCNYPVEVTRFCEKIGSLPMEVPSGLECCYENIRKICTLPFMECDPTQMDEVKVSNAYRADFAMCREVALKLGEELGRACLPKL